MVDRLPEQGRKQEESKVKRNPLADIQALRDRSDYRQIEAEMYKKWWTVFSKRVRRDEETPSS